MTEAEIQSLILKFLNSYKEGFFWRNNVIGHKGRKSKNLGSADIIGVYYSGGVGVFVAFEVKTATGKQSESQKVFEQNITSKGGFYFIVRSLEDVFRAFNSINEKLRGL